MLAYMVCAPIVFLVCGAIVCKREITTSSCLSHSMFPLLQQYQQSSQIFLQTKYLNNCAAGHVCMTTVTVFITASVPFSQQAIDRWKSLANTYLHNTCTCTVDVL